MKVNFLWKKLSLLLVGFALGVASLPLSAVWAGKSSSPMEILKSTQKKLEKILDKGFASDSERKARAEEIKKLLEPFFDFDYLARESLSDHWKKLSPEQRQEFSFWFKELLKVAYIQGVRASKKQKLKKIKYKIYYKKEEVRGKKASVFTTVKYLGTKKVCDDDVDELDEGTGPKKCRKWRKIKKWKKVNITWKFALRNGQWKIADMITNDVSLLDSYREQFGKIISKKSVSYLIKKLKKKVLSLRKKLKLPPVSYKKEKKSDNKTGKKSEKK